MATDIRVEVLATPANAATRKAYLEGLGFSVVLAEGGTFVAVDQTDVGGSDVTVNASPAWVLVGLK